MVDSGYATGFDTETFGPPYNLGVANEFHNSTKVYSDIWGTDPETGEPKSFYIPIDYAILGKWAFLYVGGCIQPAAPLRPIDSSTIPPDGKDGYFWDWDAPSRESVSKTSWDYDTEMTGLPDQIHFSYTLPPELLSASGMAQEYAIPCEVIDIDRDDSPSTIIQPYTGTKQIMGKLVISDTGVMEIRSDYVFRAYLVHKLAEGQLIRESMSVYNVECFDCGRADPAYTKIGKVAGDPTTGFWIGFKPFTLILYLGDATYSDQVNERKITESDIPTVDSPCSFVMSTGRDLNQARTDMKRFNKDKDKRKLMTIEWFKKLLEKYKNYYESLSREEKIEKVSMLYSTLKAYANKFPDFDSNFKITDYIPVVDSDEDGVPDQDEFGNSLNVNVPNFYSARKGGSSGLMEIDD